MTHDDGGGLSGYVPGGPTQHAGSGEPTGVFSAAGATAHAGSRPWRGPVRVVRRSDGYAEVIERNTRRLMATCVWPADADAIAAALNALAGCGCRAWLLDYADRQRCHKGGDTLAKWLEEIATRLPAPAICPDHDSAEPCPLHRVVKLNPGFPVRVEGGVATSGPNAPDAIYEAAHGLIIGASRPDDAAEIGQLREALAAKDAEIARLREENERLRRLTENALPDAEMERDMAEARVHELDAEVSTLRAALAAAEAKHQQMVQYTADLAWVASGVRFGARQWGRELWLAAWMVAAGGDYLSTEMWTNLLDGLGEARAELERAAAERDAARAEVDGMARWNTQLMRRLIELDRAHGGAA